MTGPHKTFAACAAVVSLALLGACGEKPQTNAQGVKHDTAPWQGTASADGQAGKAFSASGWQPGDKASWEAELKTRTQNGQNEYNRMP